MNRGYTALEFIVGGFLAVLVVGGIIMAASSGSNSGNTTGTDSSLQSTVLPGQDIPVPTGYVNDFAGVLNASTTAITEKRLVDFASSGKGEISVLIVKSLNGLSIEEYGIRVAEAWKVGKYGQDNGDILIISTGDRKVRIETGSGSKITDSQAKQILTDSIVPFLKTNDWDDGVMSGVDAIIKAMN